MHWHAFEDVSFGDGFVEVCFPQMMSFENIDKLDSSKPTEKGFNIFWHANRQLEILMIDSNKKMALSTLLEMLSGNSSIRSIKIILPNNEPFTNVIEPSSLNDLPTNTLQFFGLFYQDTNL